MGYVAPTWQNGGPPALNAKNMQDISDSLAYVSNNMVNPNLLDNWYFGKPVNQRGQTSYTSAGYAIDRWIFSTSDGHVAILDGSLEIFSPGQYGAYLSQTIETALTKSLAGQVVTASVLAAAGDEAFSFNLSKDDVYVNSFTIHPNTVSSMTFTIPTDATKISWTFAGNAAGYVRPIAVKLELGSEQTLAHQDANGNWVLNEIPKFGDQLAECQRYYYRLYGTTQLFALTAPAFCSTGGTVYISVALPVPMRALPVVSVHNTTLELFGGGTKYIKTLDGGLQHYACENSTDIILAMTNSTDASGVTIPTNTVLTASAETIDFAFDANL